MTDRTRPGARAWLLVAAGMFAWLAATAWARPLMLPDEGRYVGVAWEMLVSGDWLTPTLAGLPFFHKPPLFYWIGAGALALFGPHEWAARAAPLLGAWLGAMALCLFSARWANRRTAWMAGMVLLAQPLFLVGAQFANLDMLVAGCITATVLLAAHAVLLQEAGAPYRAVLAGAYAMAALGVLAKGLIGAALPALVIPLWLLATGRGRRLLALIWVPGLLLFLAVAGPWFVAMQWRYPGFLNYFFVVQHFQRFAGGGFNNVQAWWFYPAVLGLFHLFWLPWVARLCTPSALAAARRDPVRMLMWTWLVVVVVFFSLPQSKLVGYVLPAVPPLAFLLGDSLVRWCADGPAQRPGHSLRWAIGASAVAALTGLAAVAWLAVYPPESTRDLARVLHKQRAPGEPVFMLGRYHYDLPFYAGMRTPARVVDQWNDPRIAQGDSWRKEFADAGSFAPAQAIATLVETAQLPLALCHGTVSWVVGSTEHPPAPFAEDGVTGPAAAVVFTGKEATLWRVDTTRPAVARWLRCTGSPHADSAPS